MALLRYLTKIVSVEPVVFFYMATMQFSYNLSTSLLVAKACDLTGSMSGKLISANCSDEVAAQHVVVPINGWKALVQQLVPITLAMAAGTWSDRYGRRRRPLVAWSVAGQIAADVASLFCVVRWSVSPVATAAAQAVALSLSGGSPLLFTGINAYVADVTSDEMRTLRYCTVCGAISMGLMVGMTVYGTVAANAGFVTAYSLCVGMGLVTMALTFVLVKDGVDKSDACPPALSPRGPHKSSTCSDIASIVNPVAVFRGCYGVLTKRRQGHGKVVLCLAVLACAPLTCAAFEGEMSLMFLFLRYKFQWTEVQFTIFNVYTIIVVFIGVVLAMNILSQKFHMNDALIGMISSILDLLAAIAFLLVSQSWQLYLVPPLEIFRGAATALTNSIASKCVGSNELGSMYSIKLLTESTIKGAFIPFYNFVYNCTFEMMPSAYFIISIGLTAPLVLIFGVMYRLSRSQKSMNLGDNNKTISANKPINNCDSHL